MVSSQIQKLAEEWLRLDQDPITRDEIYHLLVQNNEDELSARLSTRIAFGTAGLRAKMEAGFSRMNSLTVIQASQGLAEYLLETQENVKHRGVVVGRDARHNSERFAKLAAAAFVARGIRVWWYGETVHTPLVPFGVDKLNAAAGVMITASHNPKNDNGYKVYWSNGCQINPPHDSGIAAAIERSLEPKSWSTSCIDDDSLLVESALGLVRDAYFRAVKCETLTEKVSVDECDLSKPAIPGGSELLFVYTPMHGIGLPYMTRAVQELGLGDNMVVVSCQKDPDPEFPTVRFPNPEEMGALDEAKKTADANDIPLILASDPDADRFAAAEKVDGTWHQFTGNQTGVLLAAHVFETFPTQDREKLAMLATTVSSRMLAVMAEKEGFHYTETLTGFRWLGNAAQDLTKQGLKPTFAFEEALGYMMPRILHDKDSVSAAIMWLIAADRWRRADGLSPYQKLQQLYAKYGYFEDANTYVRSPSPDKTNAVFANIRSLGDPYPQTVGGRRILQWRDLTNGYDSTTEDHVPKLPVSKSTQMITCELEGNVRFTVRGSGTEPKIKLYIECSAESWEEAQKGASEMQKAVIAEWFRPEENGLEVP